MPLRHAPGLALNLGNLLERHIDLEVADPYWRAVDRFVGLFDPVQNFILRPCRHRRLLPEQFTRAVEHLARRRVVVGHRPVDFHLNECCVIAKPFVFGRRALVPLKLRAVHR